MILGRSDEGGYFALTENPVCTDKALDVVSATDCIQAPHQPLVAHAKPVGNNAGTAGKRGRYELPVELALVTRITTEQLVGPLPGKDDLDLLTGQTGQIVHWHNRRRCQRLFHDRDTGAHRV